MYARAIARTMTTLKSPHFLSLLIKTALLTLVAFMALVAVVGVATRSFDFFSDPSAELAADVAITVLTSIICLALMPTLLPAIAAQFQESIANRIEEVDYPEYMPPKGDRSWHIEMWEEVKFVGLLILLNIFILMFIWIPPLYFLAYYGFNSYLIGREFFETAAARHVGRVEARRLRRANRMPALLAGLTIVVLANIPLVNLTAPFIGVTLMVHLYHLLPSGKVEILEPQ